MFKRLAQFLFFSLNSIIPKGGQVKYKKNKNVLQVKANKPFKMTTHDSKLAIMAVSIVQCVFAQYSLIFQTAQCKKHKSSIVDSFIQDKLSASHSGL